MKKTCVAPSNIAFIKYWGKKNQELKLPENGSISMCLSDLLTTTTVEFDEKYDFDEIIINNKKEEIAGSKAIKHLDRIRKLAGVNMKAKVVTNNNFPAGTGLSSSASGFAALSVAGAFAAGLNLSEKELSILARRGSGSACRSIPSGFVEWLDGDTSESSFAKSIFPSDHWKIVDVVAIVSTEKKDVASTAGQKLANSSPFFESRLSRINNKIKSIKELIQKKDFTNFGSLVEAEALELHAVMLTSSPSLIYWTPGTLKIMKLCKKWRGEGLEGYFTINTGQDVHLIIEEKNIEKLKKELEKIPEVQKIIVNYPSSGARLVENHLF